MNSDMNPQNYHGLTWFYSGKNYELGGTNYYQETLAKKLHTSLKWIEITLIYGMIHT